MTTRSDVVADLASTRTIQLTTIGRRSGKQRTVEIWWFHINGRFVITGTPGRRDWYANVLSNPDIQISTNTGAFAATAMPIEDAEFRRTVFTQPSANWYSTQDGLDRLVKTAPMIEILFHLD